MFGGVAGVASVVITLVGFVNDHLPVGVVAGLVAMLIGVWLLYRWGRGQDRARSGRRFLLPVAATVVGAALASVSATLTFVDPGGASADDGSGATSGPSPGATTTTSAKRAASAGTTTTTPPTTSPTTSTGAATAGPPSTAEERAGADIAINREYGIDLDSPDPDWEMEKVGGVCGGEFDFCHTWSDLAAPEDLAKVAGEVDHAACAASSGRTREVDMEDVRVGDVYCVKTEGGRWARVTIKGKAPTAQPSITVDVLVWDAPGA